VRISQGWWVVGCAFLLALWGWGLGFYGLAVYLVSLRAARPWSTADISTAFTAYYFMGAVLTIFSGDVFRRVGPRVAVTGAALAMAAAVAALPVVTTLGQLYLAMAAMAVAWSGMSLAAVNILVAPWFVERRGAALSLALTGASCGGVLVAPSLLWLIERQGFAPAMWAVAAVMLATLVPAVLATLRPSPPSAAGAAAAPVAAPRRHALGTVRYWTISVSYAMGLAAQVGVITHLVAFLVPRLGIDGAGVALSVTTLCAVLGRFYLGPAVSRLGPRPVSCLNFLQEAVGLALLVTATGAPVLYAGCVLVGLAVGNMITLPGLLVQSEFEPAAFGAVVSLIVGINQFAYALAPAAVGILRDRTGGYGAALGLCIALLVAAAALILVRERSLSRA
jgi:predicted MFS family arabinose efflux permease